MVNPPYSSSLNWVLCVLAHLELRNYNESPHKMDYVGKDLKSMHVLFEWSFRDILSILASFICWAASSKLWKLCMILDATGEVLDLVCGSSLFHSTMWALTPPCPAGRLCNFILGFITVIGLRMQKTSYVFPIIGTFMLRVRHRSFLAIHLSTLLYFENDRWA